jgi:hypothetical protein
MGIHDRFYFGYDNDDASIIKIGFTSRTVWRRAQEVNITAYRVVDVFYNNAKRGELCRILEDTMRTLLLCDNSGLIEYQIGLDHFKLAPTSTPGEVERLIDNYITKAFKLCNFGLVSEWFGANKTFNKKAYCQIHKGRVTPYSW